MYEQDQEEVYTGEEQFAAGGEDLFFEDTGEEQPAEAEAEEAACEEEGLFFEDTGFAEGGDEGATLVEESVVEEVFEEAVEEAVVEEAFVEEAEAVVEEAFMEEAFVEEAFVEEAFVEEAVVEEAVFEEAVEEVVFEEVVSEEVAYDRDAEDAGEAIAEGEPVAMEQDGGFYIENGGEMIFIPGPGAAAAATEEVVEEAAEEATAEEIPVAEDVTVDEVVGEELFAEEVPSEEQQVLQETADMFVVDVAGDDGAVEFAEEPQEELVVTEEGFFTEELVTEEIPAEEEADAPADVEAIDDDIDAELRAMEEAWQEAVVEVPIPEAPPMPDLDEAPMDAEIEGSCAALFGDAVASSFGEFDEPPSKRQKLAEEGSSPMSPIMLDSPMGLDSPAPNDVEDLSASPASPAFTAPKAKWSGAVRPPVGVSKAGVLPSGTKAPMATRPSAAKSVPFAFAAKAGAPVRAASAGVTAQSSSLNKMQGYLFSCNNATMREVANRRLMGSPDREMAQMRKSVMPNTSIFLMNFESMQLLGPFAPDGAPEQAIVKAAFGGRFGAQLRVKPTEKLMMASIDTRFPGGPKDAAGMRLVQSAMATARPAPPDITSLWKASAQAASPVAASPMAASPRAVASLRPTFGVVPGQPPWQRPAQQPPAQRHMLPGTPLAAAAAQLSGAFRGFVPGMDATGRQYDLSVVVLSFCHVGGTYATKVKKDTREKAFDWDGVRRCLLQLTQEVGVQVVGCMFENFTGIDRNGSKVEVPRDIKNMCVSIQETPRLITTNQKTADDEMTIKCAYRRNCRFLYNDNCADWLQAIRDEKIKVWLTQCQELLQMRYFFDTDLGTFDLLDGNIPQGLLDPTMKNHPSRR